MVIKLKSILKKIPWLLVGRAFTLAALWLFAPWWAFAVIALFIYVRSSNSIYNLFEFFVIVLILSKVSDSWLTSGIKDTPLMNVKSLLGVILSGFFGSLFFLFLGIKELFFVRRREFYLVAVTLTFFLTAFFTLWSLKPGTPSLKALLFTVIVFILGISLSRFSVRQLSSGIVFTYFGILTFVITELLWVFSYTSFSIINASVLLTAFFFAVNSLYFVLPGSENASRDIFGGKI